MRALSACLFVVATLSLPVLSRQVSVPAGAPAVHDIRPGPGVTAVKMCRPMRRAWKARLATRRSTCSRAGTRATVFVAGGTHGNEIAGIMAAVVLVERARVQKAG